MTQQTSPYGQSQSGTEASKGRLRDMADAAGETVKDAAKLTEDVAQLTAWPVGNRFTGLGRQGSIKGHADTARICPRASHSQPHHSDTMRRSTGLRYFRQSAPSAKARIGAPASVPRAVLSWISPRTAPPAFSPPGPAERVDGLAPPTDAPFHHRGSVQLADESLLRRVV
jgi:hypothetical protein